MSGYITHKHEDNKR